jgi:hypothetical protein
MSAKPLQLLACRHCNDRGWLRGSDGFAVSCFGCEQEQAVGKVQAKRALAGARRRARLEAITRGHLELAPPHLPVGT